MTEAREQAVASVRRGWELHYAKTAASPDLALLDGDRLYADGLEALARAEDLEGVAILADLISRCAQAAAEDRADQADSAWREALEALR